MTKELTDEISRLKGQLDAERLNTKTATDANSVLVKEKDALQTKVDSYEDEKRTGIEEAVHSANPDYECKNKTNSELTMYLEGWHSAAKKKVEDPQEDEKKKKKKTVIPGATEEAAHSTGEKKGTGFLSALY